MKKALLLSTLFLLASPAFSQSDATLEETKEWIIEKVNDILTPHEKKVTFYNSDPHLADGSYFNFRAYDAEESFNIEYEYEKVYIKGTLGEANYIHAVMKGKEKISIRWKDVIPLVGPTNDGFRFQGEYFAVCLVAGKGTLSYNGTTKTIIGRDFKGIVHPFDETEYTAIQRVFATNISREDVDSYTIRFVKAIDHLRKFYKKQEKF